MDLNKHKIWVHVHNDKNDKTCTKRNILHIPFAPSHLPTNPHSYSERASRLSKNRWQNLNNEPLHMSKLQYEINSECPQNQTLSAETESRTNVHGGVWDALSSPRMSYSCLSALYMALSEGSSSFSPILDQLWNTYEWGKCRVCYKPCFSTLLRLQLRFR